MIPHPHNFFPRSAFQMDNWMNPLNPTIDWFDPFDELDHMIGRNMEWLQRPKFIEPLPSKPKVPHKYRITVDCAGHDPKSIKTEFKDDKLVVYGRDEIKTDTDDYSIKEFKKSYKLPDNAEVDKLVSFFAGGQLVIEVPLKEDKPEDLFPKIIDNKDGTKQLALNCSIPQGIDPSKVHVTCKDRDIIVKAEDKIEKPDSISRTYYYKRCTLPENTDFNALKCHFENNKLSIEAPINPGLKYHKHIPIEYKTNGTTHKTH